MDKQPLVSLLNVTRSFVSGDQTMTVLDKISLQIHAGEMVAIVGPSGSGKSTLMNVIGCLDKPDAGEMQIAGVNTLDANSNQLATLRSQHIGFIFQRYHLMPYLNAMENVMVPARYTALPPDKQKERAEYILTRLGLADRLLYKPTQLSGGQQQRVSVARALMNGASIILADEPTGALDGKSGEDLMAVLHELHHAGHTIILVTHDLNIASQANRIVALNDGRIIEDRANKADKPSAVLGVLPAAKETGRAHAWQNFHDVVFMAWQALSGHRIRAILSMLGIIIGVASVITSMAVGEGVKQKIISDLSAMGTKSMFVRPGLGWDNPRPDFADSLSMLDAENLSHQSCLERVSPVFNQSTAAIVNGKSMFFELTGVNQDYFAIKGMRLRAGRGFNQRDITDREPVTIIDDSTAETLFPQVANPSGNIVLFAGIPFVIIGVMEPKGIKYPGGGLKAWLPHTSMLERVVGPSAVQSIEIQVKENTPLDEAQRMTERLLEDSHGRRDFFIYSDDMMLAAVQKTSDSMTLLIATIAGISLMVGGIGVMNIMLVSVTERTHEIGIRLAVGAREKDIMNQFLVESVVICLVGSAIGIVLTCVLGSVFSWFSDQYKLVFSWMPIFFSCGFSVLIGLLFGFFPARNAARLNPTQALARE